jgi:hypothetical protein
MLPKRKRLQEELERLQQKYALLSEKLTALEKDRIVETRSNEALRLDHEIESTRAMRDAVELEMDMVEEKQRDLDTAPIPPARSSKPARRKAPPKPGGSVAVATANAALENPYEPRKPLVPPRFIGREKECRLILKSIMERRSISLVADFYLGKSSLLQTIALEAEKIGQKVVSLSGLNGYSHCLSAFIQEITGRPAEDEPDCAADRLDAWLSQHTRYDLVPLLLMDDADQCFGSFPMRFFERLRGMLGRTSIIFASHRELDLVQQEVQRTSTLQNSLQIMRLGLLDELAAEKLVLAGSAALNEKQLQLMREWGGRHPFYLQLLGMNLIRAVENGDSDESALDTFYTEATPKFRHQWQYLDERERAALQGIANGNTLSQRDLRPLRVRGLITEKGRLFGRILQEWLEQKT